jgi:hypothetical protein
MRYIMFGYNELPDDKLDREYFYYDNEEMKVLRLRYRLEFNYNLIFAVAIVCVLLVSFFREKIINFGVNMDTKVAMTLLIVISICGVVLGIVIAKRKIKRMEMDSVQITREKLRESYGIDKVKNMARVGKICTIVLPLVEILFIVVALGNPHLLLVPILECLIMQFGITYNWYLSNPLILIKMYKEATKE